MGVQGTAAPAMSSAAWDRALQQEMKVEGNLHPALCTPDGHYQARLELQPCRGHTQRALRLCSVLQPGNVASWSGQRDMRHGGTAWSAFLMASG